MGTLKAVIEVTNFITMVLLSKDGIAIVTATMGKEVEAGFEVEEENNWRDNVDSKTKEEDNWNSQEIAANLNNVRLSWARLERRELRWKLVELAEKCHNR